MAGMRARTSLCGNRHTAPGFWADTYRVRLHHYHRRSSACIRIVSMAALLPSSMCACFAWVVLLIWGCFLCPWILFTDSVRLDGRRVLFLRCIALIPGCLGRNGVACHALHRLSGTTVSSLCFR